MNLTQSVADPCLFYKRKQGKLTLLLTIHVDDTLVAGEKEEVDWFCNTIRKRFNIQNLGQLKKHLGVWWNWDKDKDGNTTLTATMPSMIEDITKLYTETTKERIKHFNTPAYPGTTLTKNEAPEPENIDAYRSIVGKLLYLMTKVAPNIANAVRELATHLSNPGKQHWRAVGRLVGYLDAHGKQGLTFRQPRDLKATSYSDTDFAKSPDDRRSISGRLVTIGGTLVSWQSKKQQTVTLSSTEAEYIGLSECCQDTYFITMLLSEILDKPANKLTATIHCDNTGAIYLAKNQQVGARTKHIDIKHHFIREMIEEKKVNIRFVGTEDNPADTLTKNVSEKIFNKFCPDIMNGTLTCWREDVARYNDVMSKATVSVTREGQSLSSLNKSIKCELQDHLTEELDRVANYWDIRKSTQVPDDTIGWTVVRRRKRESLAKG
jgi:hypothetical protein